MSIHNRTHPLTPMASAGSFLCYQLYEGGKTIGTLGLNGLQLVLICISSLFVAFLLFRLPSSIRKIRDNPAPLRTLYYCILWVRYLFFRPFVSFCHCPNILSIKTERTVCCVSRLSHRHYNPCSLQFFSNIA
jgi:hypothetical protein